MTILGKPQVLTDIDNLQSTVSTHSTQLEDIAIELDKYIGITDSDKLNNAISNLNGKNGIISLSRIYTLSQVVSVPNNITFKFNNGGILKVNSGVKVNIKGNIQAGIFQIFDCIASDIMLTELKQEAYPQWFGAKGDRITNDNNAMNCLIYSGCPVVRIPKGEYQAYIGNGFSNRTFIFDEGSIIDGVIHIANGDGIGVNPNATTVTYVDNVRCLGTMTSTIRVGSYYCRNVNIDKIHLVETNSKWVNQTVEGGQKGNHFTSGTENLYVGEQIIEGTTSLTYALGIDKYPSDTVNLPKNIKFGTVIINNCSTSAIAFTDFDGLTVDTLIINSYDKYSNNFSTGKNLRIGKLYVNGQATTTANLFGMYSQGITNFSIDELITEHNTNGMYVLSGTNVTINKITANNNTGKGIYITNCNNAYLGICASYNNGQEGVHFKSPVMVKQIFSYGNNSMGVLFDGVNGCNNSRVEKIVAYNNNNYNVFIGGNNNSVVELLAYNPIGAKYSVNISSSTNCKVDFMETYGATQGVRFLANTNFFGRYIYTHDNTTGFAMDSSSNGVYLDYIKYSNNTTNISGGTIPATVLTT